MEQIDYIEAKKIAYDYIKELEQRMIYNKKIAYNYVEGQEQNIDLVLMEEEVITKDFGWVFFYATKKYMLTKYWKDGLAGNAPIIVDKNTGKITVTGTASSINYYIEQYEKYGYIKPL